MQRYRNILRNILIFLRNNSKLTFFNFYGMEAKDRIMALLEYLDMSKHEFERVCGLSNGYISKIRKSIGYKGLEKILEQFPQINKNWLRFGEGEMLKPNTQSRTIISGTGNINNNSINSPIENSVFHCCNEEHVSAEIEKLKKEIMRLIIVIANYVIPKGLNNGITI